MPEALTDLEIRTLRQMLEARESEIQAYIKSMDEPHYNHLEALRELDRTIFHDKKGSDPLTPK